MTEPKEPGLFLHLTPANSPVYEAECEQCNGKGKEIGTPLMGNPRMYSCPHCHGTGKVRKCVVGWVEIIHRAEIYGWNYGYAVACITLSKIKLVERRGQSFEESDIKFIEYIIEAYHAGTLPDSVAANLEEVDA